MSNYKLALIALLGLITFGYAFANMTDTKTKVKPSQALLVLAINGICIWLAIVA